MQEIWTGKRVWCGSYNHPYDPTVFVHEGKFYVRRRYIGADWSGQTILQILGVKKFEARVFVAWEDMNSVSKEEAISYMASHGESPTDAAARVQ